jgi:hypothetical protein
MPQRPYSYLESLPLTDEEKEKITNQGYDSPACLYGIIKAGGDVVWQWLGRKCHDELVAALEKQLTADELNELNKPVPRYPAMGYVAPKIGDVLLEIRAASADEATLIAQSIAGFTPRDGEPIPCNTDTFIVAGYATQPPAHPQLVSVHPNSQINIPPPDSDVQ